MPEHGKKYFSYHSCCYSTILSFCYSITLVKRKDFVLPSDPWLHTILNDISVIVKDQTWPLKKLQSLVGMLMTIQDALPVNY